MTEHRDPGRKRPRTVLVLGGGGMRGMAHIGAIRALERLGIEVDAVVGTSMGAILGSLWCAGYEGQALEDVAREIQIKDFLRLKLVKFLVRGYRHASVYKGKHFRAFLSERLGDKGFDDLRRPFHCNALSLTRGSVRYFGLPGDRSVPLIDAVYASSCLPGVFEPMELEGDHYVDGGMAETLCLKLAHALEPDLIIAVDLSLVDRHAETPFRATLPHILLQTYSVIGSVLNEHALHRWVDDKVVLLRPKVQDVGVLSQPDIAEVIRLGERETLEVLSTHPMTRYLCEPDAVQQVDRTIRTPRDYVELDVDPNACIHCGVCAVTCATNGFAAVPSGDVVRKHHNYECCRDTACERSCPTNAITLRNL